MLVVKKKDIPVGSTSIIFVARKVLLLLSRYSAGKTSEDVAEMQCQRGVGRGLASVASGLQVLRGELWQSVTVVVPHKPICALDFMRHRIHDLSHCARKHLFPAPLF